MDVHESSVSLSSTTNPSLGVTIPVPAQAHLLLYSCKRQSHLALRTTCHTTHNLTKCVWIIMHAGFFVGEGGVVCVMVIVD